MPPHLISDIIYNMNVNSIFYLQIFGRVFVFIAILAVLFTAFLLLSNTARAADAGEYVFFRVDTELDIPNAKDTSNKVTVRWYCDGATTFGQITDNTASESTNTLDGIIKVASNSKEMTDSSCTIGASETLRASVSLDGWVEREWTAASFPGASTSVEFTQRASMDYTIVVNGVDDELGTAITLNGTTASAQYDLGVASQSYSGGKKYIAGTATNGTVKADADGYVSRTSSAIGAINSTTSKSIDFGVETDSDVDESGLNFGHKISVTYSDSQASSAVSGTNVIAGDVTAGDSLGTSCTKGTGSNVGKWYCPVPLAHTATTASFRHDDLTPDPATATYADRSSETDAQTTATISTSKKSAGGGGSSTPFVTTPTPTPTVSVTPTPIPGVTSSPTPTPSSVVASPTATPTVVMLFRKANDPKVYVQRSDGTLSWVKTLTDFYAAGYRWADVKVISGSEFGKMRVGGQIRVVQGISYLRVRSGPSTKNAILDTVTPGRVLQFYGWENGWYKIKRTDGNFGWVSGVYVKEF